jgi:two-component system response regulator NreC
MPRHPRLVAVNPHPSDGVTAEACVRVVLAEDHATMRRSLRLLLDSEPDLEVVAEAGDQATAIGHVHGHRPQVLVLDLRMPSGSSIETIRRLRAHAPGTEVVVITMQESPAFAKHALDAGAIGYVLKDTADAELPEAVRHAARGELYTSPRVSPSWPRFSADATRPGSLRRGLLST